MTELEELQAQLIAQRLMIAALLDRIGLTNEERANMLVKAKIDLCLNDCVRPSPFMQGAYDHFSKFLLPPPPLPDWLLDDSE